MTWVGSTRSESTQTIGAYMDTTLLSLGLASFIVAAGLLWIGWRVQDAPPPWMRLQAAQLLASAHSGDILHRGSFRNPTILGAHVTWSGRPLQPSPMERSART